MRLFCLLVLSVPLLAQYGEFSFHAGASRITPNKIGTIVGQSSGNNFDALLDNGWLFGFRTTLNQGAIFGHEFGYNYSRTKLRYRPLEAGAGTEQANGMAVHRSFYNFLLYMLPQGSKLRPFVTGGGHFANYVQPGARVQYGEGDNKFGVNYGAGIKFRVTERWMIRADARQYLQGRPFGQYLNNSSGHFHNTEISLGFSFTL